MHNNNYSIALQRPQHTHNVICALTLVGSGCALLPTPILAAPDSELTYRLVAEDGIEFIIIHIKRT